MDSLPSAPVSAKPTVHKEILVGLLVGGMLGPVVGWFIGTFATFFAVVAVDDSRNNTRVMRPSAFIGGLIGIPLGLVIGLVVSVPLRVLSARVLRFLRNPWLAA